ncbi:ATP phosphoribosyltransferase regulatory subunit [Polymorphobacter multimanifer]|uniref:ATP phosphoribosyltransferase regulatory subunit n=1 Tax=Polymorphobacter multimanifer TaxID=1070431 RepID=UPI00166BB605|nr:ATP phosphoribosyltransferase regulatory subunit [Polymorphobacter multimanifer]GGI77311.1 ATP phosphoribosyltransferase regulatory subunit [Polymorphobacter multimanifer]
MLPPGLLPEGLRDRLPPAAEAQATLTATMMAVFAAHGHERVSPPLVEYEESLGSRLASAQRRELLRFTDPVSQHTLALRSDITGQVGRIAVTRMAAAPRPLRLSYAGPVLRVRGSQLAPERQSQQIGAELIGLDSPAAARAMLALAVEALLAAGVPDLSIDLTLPTLVADLHAAGLPAGTADLPTLQALLDGKDAASLRAHGASAYEPLIAAAGPADAALARLAALPLPAGRLDAVAAVVAALAPLDISVTLDPTERHGFEYQSWLGFSLFGAGLPFEIGRGGSYTLLHPDGTPEAALGFSLYIDSLVEAGLGTTARPRVFLALGTPQAEGEALRAQGFITIAALCEACTPQGCTHIYEAGHARPLA